MCESATTTTTTMVSNRDSLRCCWIIYTNSQGREHLTVTETKTTGPQQDKPPTRIIDNSESTLDIESMKEILDPNLRPPTPDPNSRLSQQIFDEHIQLTQEYFKVQTELAYLTRHRDELIQEMTPAEREEKLEYLRRLKEKEGLLKLQSNLKLQLELIRKGPSQQNQQQQQPQQQQQQQQLIQNNATTSQRARPHQNENGWVLISPNQQ